MTHLTTDQRACLHIYFRQLSDALNNAGLTPSEIVTLPSRWTEERVKYIIGHEYMRAMWPTKTSTMSLSTSQVSELYETINVATAEKWGVGIPWPVGPISKT